jgi:uncharacterized protein YecE (DUF72 family)
MPARILVGTASWAAPSLVKCGLFYPADARSPEARLRFYASRFPLVEVDSSYYAMPERSNAALWAARTPDGFLFNVKAFRLFTGHQTPLASLPADVRAALIDAIGDRKHNVYYADVPPALLDVLWGRFFDALAPLADAGRLGALHFQFAPWVMFGRRGFAQVEACVERLRGYRVAVEFRHRSWFDERHAAQTLELERRHDLAHVVVDEPQGFANTIPAVWEVASPALTVVRLHGRNAATWNLRVASSAERFNYDYPDRELEELAASITALAQRTQVVHVIFNNNFEDQGQRNALSLLRILGPDVTKTRHPAPPVV